MSHIGIMTTAPGLGWWVECDCGWTSACTPLAPEARRDHDMHRVTS